MRPQSQPAMHHCPTVQLAVELSWVHSIWTYLKWNCSLLDEELNMLTEWDVHFDVGAFSIWKIGWKEARSYKHGRIFPILWGEPWVPPHLFDCKPRSIIKLQKRLRRRFSECWHQNDSMIVKDDYFLVSLRCTSLESVCHTNMAFAFCKFRGVIQRSL